MRFTYAFSRHIHQTTYKAFSPCIWSRHIFPENQTLTVMLLTQNPVFVVVTSQQFNNHILLPSFASRLAVTYKWPHKKSIRLVSGALDCKPAQLNMSLERLVDFKIRHGFCFTSELFLDSLNVFSVLYYALVPAWQWFYVRRRCEKIRRLGRCEIKAQHQRCYAGTVTLMRTSVTRNTLSHPDANLDFLCQRLASVGRATFFFLPEKGRCCCVIEKDNPSPKMSGLTGTINWFSRIS